MFLFRVEVVSDRTFTLAASLVCATPWVLIFQASTALHFASRKFSDTHRLGLGPGFSNAPPFLVLLAIGLLVWRERALELCSARGSRVQPTLGQVFTVQSRSRPRERCRRVYWDTPPPFYLWLIHLSPVSAPEGEGVMGFAPPPLVASV